MDDLTVQQWGRLVAASEPQSIESVADELARRLDLSATKARNHVELAIEGGPLSLDEERGTFGTIRVESDEDRIANAEETQTPDETPTPDGVGSASTDASDGYEAIFSRAQDIGDREPWEFVTEDDLYRST